MGKEMKLPELIPYERLCGMDSSVQSNTDDSVVMFETKQLYHYKNHTFRIKKNRSFAELVESISCYGILEPLLIRLDQEGMGEIIAGNRRFEAALINHLTEVPCIIKKAADMKADGMMVDTNIHRHDDELCPSEIAYSYLAKKKSMEAEKTGHGTCEELADLFEQNKNTIHRYLRLTYLQPELMQMVDEGKIAVIPAVELSYLQEEEQRCLISVIHEAGSKIDGGQAVQLRNFSKEEKLTRELIQVILGKKDPEIKVTLNTKTLSRYFPRGTQKEEMEEIILELLEQWQRKVKTEEKDYEV